MRVCLLTCLFSAVLCWAAAPAIPSNSKPVSLRGKLVQTAGQPPALETADHKRILLDGDEGTRKVLEDSRLPGFDLEAKGHFTAPDHFLVDPLFSKAMVVHKNGQVKVITYWCDTCSIRTYSPGPCVCCQQETTLDLRDPDAYK